MSSLGHWICNIEIPQEYYGFIYLITNNTNNRKYIGKKQCKSKRKKPLRKGKKKRESVIKETDWMTYTSSCNELNDDIAKLGKENFTFEILTFFLIKEARKIGFNNIIQLVCR